jgi:hypothetical protein
MTQTQQIESSTRSSVAIPASVAALTAAGIAAYQALTPGSPGATFGSLNDWARDLLFLGYLVASVLAVRASRRAGLAPRAASLLITFGYGAIAVGVSAGLVLQEDPDWFMVLGGPGNLAALAGFVTWAIWGVRTRTLPAWAALLCGVGGLVAVLFAEFGTSILIASFWCYVVARTNRSSQRISYPG